MPLRDLLMDRISSSNFQGIAIKIGEQSEVHWWNYGDSELNKIILDLKLEKSLSFHCVMGDFKILD